MTTPRGPAQQPGWQRRPPQGVAPGGVAPRPPGVPGWTPRPPALQGGPVPWGGGAPPHWGAGSTGSFAGPTPVPWRRLLVDALVLTLLVVAAGLVFAPAYGGAEFLRALGVGAVVGALAAVAPALLRWPTAITPALLVIGYVVFGAAAAVPETAIGGVVPTGASIRALAVGVFTSWKQLLTVAVPVGHGGALLLPAFLSALLAAAASVTIAVRTRRPVLALLPAAAMAGSSALLASSTPFPPAVVGTCWALGAVLWASWRRGDAGLPGLDVRRPVALVAVVVPVIAAGVLLGPLLTSQETPRTVARELVQPPFDPSSVASPLSAYRRYVVADREKPQLTVSGLPDGMPLRLAVLDDYSGQYYSTSADVGTFNRIGNRVAQVPPGRRISIDVTVDQYADVWVPAVGFLSSVDFGGPDAVRLREDFRYNRETGAAVVTSGLRTGDVLHLTASVPDQPTVQQLGDTPVADVVQDPLAKSIPEVVSRAGEWGGSGAPAQVVENLRQALRDAGYVSHGDTDSGVPGGHGADRIRSLLTAKVMRGDAEQYAVALALMVRAKGYPARVVVGFKGPEAGRADGTDVVAGSRLTAWVEVPFAGYGWVAFDPLPDEQKPPPTQQPDENQSQADPQQIQPPPPPVPPKQAQADAQDDTDTPDEPQQDDDQQDAPPPPAASGMVWGWIAIGGGMGVLLLLPLLVIVLLKQRRRRRLARTGTPDQRIAGGWRYLLARAVDLGITPQRGTTRVEAARQLQADFADRAAPPSPRRPTAPGPAGGGVAVLARRADAGIFAPEPVDPATATQFWEHLEQELAQIDRTLPPWRRIRARLSARSLRKEHR